MAEPGAQSKSTAIILQTGARLVGTLLSFFYVAACIHAIGKEGYDSYLLGLSFGNLMGLADVGILTATQRSVGEAMARNDLQRVASLFAFAQRLYTAVAALALIIFCGFAFVYTHFGVHKPNDPTLALLLLCGVQSAATLLMSPSLSIAYSLGRFREVAWTFALQGIVAPTIGFIALQIVRSPLVVAGSALIGVVVAAVVAFRLCGVAALPKPGRIERGDIRQIVSLGARTYPSTITTIVGNNADKVQVQRAGLSGSLASYSVGGRVPELIAQLLSPITSTVYPELTRLSGSDEPGFARAVERNVQFTLVLSACIILVPCGFSECILHTWLRHNLDVLPSGIVLVMPLMAFYRALELVYGVITMAFFAKGIPQYMLPFSIFNSCVTIFGTVPMYRWQGVAGVGMMNALIDLIQLAPMIIMLKRFATPGASIATLVKSFGGILGLAVLLTAAIHWGMDGQIAKWHAFVGFFAAPFFGLAALVLMTRLRFCAVPERVAARARRFQVRGVPVAALVLGLPLNQSASAEGVS